MKNHTKTIFLEFLSGLIADLKASNTDKKFISHYEKLYQDLLEELKQDKLKEQEDLAIILTLLDAFLDERKKKKEIEKELKNSKSMDYISKLNELNLEVRNSKNNPKNKL